MKTANSLCVAAMISTIALAQSAPKPTHTIAEIEPMLAKISTYEYGQSRETWVQLSLFIEESLPSPALLKQIEARLLKFLQTPATAAGKEVAFRELSLIASDASVPVLSAMLLDPRTTEMARFAVARIPGQAAGEALRKGAEKTSGNIKIGMINSLGQRRDEKSVPWLKSQLSGDPPIAEAAAAALGEIADRPALDAIAGARGKASTSIRQALSEAYLMAADHFASRGDKVTALKVYKELLSPQETETVRVAALKGLAETGGKTALPSIVNELNSDSSKMQAVAIRTLSGMQGADVTTSLVEQFPKINTTAQVRILAALTDRGDVSARPLFVTATKNPSAEVRTAALTGLSKLGDNSNVLLLAETAATAQGLEQSAARESLARLTGPKVDDSIVSAIGIHNSKVNVELIRAAGERGISESAPTLNKAIHDNDPAVRREAMKALRSVAGASQVEPLLAMLLQSKNPTERREIAQTLGAALKRSDASANGAVITAYKNASTVDARVALLEVIGQTGSDEALAILRSASKEPTAEIARAAILALSDWPQPAPMPDLLALAQSDSSPVLQVLSLRGYLKLLALPSKRPAAESATLLGEAMRLAKQPAEKRTVLSLLPAYPSKEALQLAQSALRDQTVAKEAEVAVGRINNAMKGQ